MISAAPLYGGVHNWTSADRVRMCGINEDRRTTLSDEESKSSSAQHLGSEERCVSSVLSKVDLLPATNQSDALMLQDVGATQVETGQKPEDKPPDRSEPEPAGAIPSSKVCNNVSPPEGKAATNVSENSIQAASSRHSKKAEPARTAVQEKAAGPEHPAAQTTDADSSGKQKTILGPGLQIAGQPVDTSHAVVSSGFPFTMSRICFSTTQVPNVQKLPLSFTSGAVLTPSQPLVYIPPPSCGQPLSVTTLPTTFGVTSTLTLPIMPTCLTDLQSHAFASTLGRPLTTDPKVVPAELNKPATTAAPTVSLTNSNSMTSTADSSSICTDTSPSTLSAVQTLSAHPTLPVVSVNPVSLASYSRTPNLEPQNDSSSSSSSSVSPLKSPPQLEREMISPQDSYEMPLDLSSKSHRHKHAPPNQRKTPPMPVLTPVHTSGRPPLSTVLSRSDCSTQNPAPISFTSSSVSQNLRGVPPLVMFPEFLRNGDPVSSQLVGASGSWIKNSTLISTIPGTYVGVANPVPASLLLNKDSSLSLSTDSRHLAKQEPISIIDQGEPKNSGSCGKKNSQTGVDGQQSTEKRHLHARPTAVNSLCSSKDWTLPGHGTVHPKCPLNGKPSNSQVLPVTWSPYHQTSVLSIGIPATGTLHPNQGSHQRLPMGEFTLYSSILPAESKVAPPKSLGDTSTQQKSTTTPAAAHEPDLLAKARTCDSVSKPRKSHVNKTLLAPKPAAGNAALYLQPGLPDKADGNAEGRQGTEGSAALNKLPEKQNCKEDKIRPPKLSCSRKAFGDTKPKNKVLASYMTNDPLAVAQRKDSGHIFPLLSQESNKKDAKSDVSQDQPGHRKRGHKKAHAPVDTQPCVQEVDLSKVKIERVDDDENFGCLPSFNSASWSPVEIPPITKVKAKVKKEPGLRGRGKRLEEVTPTKPAPQKSKCKVKEKEENLEKSLQEPPKKKGKKQQSVTSLEKKEHTSPKSQKEPAGTKVRRQRRRAIKSEPLDPELDPATPERKSKNSFKDFIPVVLKSRTRSQTGIYGFQDIASPLVDTLRTEEEEEEALDEACAPYKRRKLRKNCRPGRPRKFTVIKQEPEPEFISPVIQDSWELSSRGLDTGKAAILEQDDNGEEDGTLRRRKRRRKKNSKYQNGEYLTEKEEEEVSQYYCRRRARTDFRKRKLSPDQAGEILRSNQRQTDLRNSSFRGSLEDSLQILEKPSGKRKCKTKHLGGSTDEEAKGRGRRSSLSPKSTPTKSPRKNYEPGTPCRSRRTNSFGSCDQNMPPEARRLIVNKNAGETLLQRAARLGYKDVVLYCLQRDQGDINHRDNAGYTALHEACARGWTSILQILLENGANVNCSAQDGTRPIHDAVVNDNLETVWLLLSYGADPTLATYSGQTPMKLASSEAMRTFLSDYLSDLRGRSDGDPRASWDFYSSSVLDPKDEIGHDILLDTSETSKEEEEEGEKQEEDNFLFEFSDTPLISCYNLHVSLTSGPSNWFLVSDVLKKLKLSSRIFQARYPNFEIASMQKKEFTRQVFSSQILTPAEGMDLWPQDSGEMVELVKYEPELIRLLGSAVEFQCVNS